jgi:hypothetical protein
MIIITVEVKLKRKKGITGFHMEVLGSNLELRLLSFERCGDQDISFRFKSDEDSKLIIEKTNKFFTSHSAVESFTIKEV